MAKVILKLREKILGEFALAKPEVTIGRSPENDIQIDNLAVSSYHARILREGSQYFVQDLGSLNGTYVNGEQIELRELSPGMDIAIAKHTLTFEYDTEAPAPSPGKVDTLHLDQTMVLDTRQHRELSKRQPKGVPENVVGVLLVESGKAEGKEFVVTDSHSFIGKAQEADFRIKGFFAPPIAAYVHRTEEGYFVSPPESGKPPKLNGEKVTGHVRLMDGDTLDAGGVVMRFVLRKTG